MNTTTEQIKPNQLAKKPAQLTIRQHLESPGFADQVAKVLPKHLSPERFCRVALTATMRTPALAQCDQSSFFNALLTLSQLGLEPDGRRAHLIPFRNSKRDCTEVQLIVDYKGLVELALRSGFVASIHADRVCLHDNFIFNLGQVERHEIDFRSDRGAVYCYYARAVMKEGPPICDVMTVDEVKSIRARSRAKDSGPWVTDFEEMAKKTVFRRLAKWLPLSPEFRDALDADTDSLEEKRFETAKPVPQRPQFLSHLSMPPLESEAPSPVEPEPPPNDEPPLEPPPDVEPAKPKRTRKTAPPVKAGDELRVKIEQTLDITEASFIDAAVRLEMVPNSATLESLTADEATVLMLGFDEIVRELLGEEAE